MNYRDIEFLIAWCAVMVVVAVVGASMVMR